MSLFFVSNSRFWLNLLSFTLSPLTVFAFIILQNEIRHNLSINLSFLYISLILFCCHLALAYLPESPKDSLSLRLLQFYLRGITILSHNITFNYTAFFVHFQQNTFRFCVIHFTKMDILIDTLS